MANIWSKAGAFLKEQGAEKIAGALSGLFLQKTGVITLSCGEETLVFPVVPSEFGVSVSNNNGTVNIINAGDYAMIGKTGLKEITIASFFPAQRYSFSGGAANPYELVGQIETWRSGTEPLNISVEDSPINFDCLVESFSYKEQDGSRDVYFDLHLKEYRRITDTVEDENTGLMERPSAIEQIGSDITALVMQGESPLNAIKEGLRKAAIQAGEGYLEKYLDAVKIGGIRVGDVLQVTHQGIRINGKEIEKKVLDFIK